MSDHNGFFCQKCLTEPLAFPKTCEVCCSALSDELDELYGKHHSEETGVYEVANSLDSGESLIIAILYNQGMLPYEYRYYRERGLMLMCETSQIHDTAEYHKVLDSNLLVWKTPIVEGLTKNFCWPLAVMAWSGKITVPLAKMILYFIGSCLRNKTEVFGFLESIVYNSCIMKLH